MEKNIIARAGIPYYSVPCTKLARKFTFKNFAIPFTLLTGISRAGKIIDKLKPDVVFSKGGYVSLPVVIAAKKRNIPVVAHESDYTLGLANKISCKYCKKVLTAFPETAKSLKNGEFVGAPIRKALFTADKTQGLKDFNLSGKKPIVLVTGGSLGAQAINATLRNALDDLLKKFDVLHICGKGNFSGIKKVGYVETEFTDKMENAFACADVCVSRAGANTLFEMASLAKPMLLIPLPKGVSRGDQILNARYFKNFGIARVLDQNSLTAKTLTAAIYALYNDRKRIAEKFKLHPIPNAAEIIAAILAQYSHNT